MVTLKEKQKIILSYFHDGDSIRKIARDNELHRKTVKSYIDEYSKIKANLIKTTDIDEMPELIDSIVETPKYNLANRDKRKISNGIIEDVKTCLSANQVKKTNGQHKQLMKKIDIFEFLKQQNYDIGYTTICNLINKLENQSKEAFIRQEYELGDICEFDWGEVKIFIDGKLTVLNMAVFTSAAGNFRYARLFYKQNTQSFQQAHAMFFEHINGVYKTLVYDNMRVAVRKFVGPTEKLPTEGLLKLSIYYTFNFRFCNVRKGNEKGHVERSVEYVRRKAFCINDKFDTLEEANESLLEHCEILNNKPIKEQDNKSPYEILNVEKKHLLPILPKFECSIPSNLKVDKYSTISVDTCRYSVPEKYVGKVIFVKIYPDKIICYYNNEKIAIHTKKTGLFKWYIKLEHYLMTFKRKPGALLNSVAFKQTSEKLQTIHEKYYLNNVKDFIELLHFMYDENKTPYDIETAILKIIKLNIRTITTDQIKLIVCNKKTKSISNDNFNSPIVDFAKQQLLCLVSLIPGNKIFNKEEQ